MDLSPLPLGSAAQLRVDRGRQVALAGRPVPPDVRTVVAHSWSRAVAAGVSTVLPRAPVVLAEDALHARREAVDWLDAALRAVEAQRGAYSGGGHVLTLFDAEGRMLHGEGDPAALERLEEINFRPGALWSEAAVGTNGPGTALATGAPVHIVGSEHFCDAWTPWHCAAAPVRDLLTGRILGAVDLSGRRDGAHPHALTLAIAVAVAAEQMLVSREMERRVAVLRRYSELAARWPGEGMVAVDRSGAVLAASPGAPPALNPLAPLPPGLRAALADAVAEAAGNLPHEVRLPVPGLASVVAHPVLDGRTPAGAVLVVRAPERAPAARRRPGATRYSLLDPVGASPLLAEAHRVALAAAANALPVLVLGESGTGKEMFAQGIHAAGPRADRPFIAVNCGAIPAELVESELFGYVGGAFSGSRRGGSEGKFEAAQGGTLFLDEVGDLPLSAQAALLRVLQEGEVTRVGATRGIPVDVRVIAATHRDLEAGIRAGSFREDLFYRLSVLSIHLPPLRARGEDVVALARTFLAEAEAELGRVGHHYEPEALDAFRAYGWPGNVRELRNVIWRAVALTTAPGIGLADLPEPLRHAVGAAQRLPAAAPRAERDPQWARERERLARVVESAAGMDDAARILGIGRSTLYRRLARYGLQPGRVVKDA